MTTSTCGSAAWRRTTSPAAASGRRSERIVADQFTRARDGDRFWYQRDLSSASCDLIGNTTPGRRHPRNTAPTSRTTSSFSTRPRPAASGTTATATACSIAARPARSPAGRSVCSTRTAISWPPRARTGTATTSSRHPDRRLHTRGRSPRGLAIHHRRHARFHRHARPELRARRTSAST